MSETRAARSHSRLRPRLGRRLGDASAPQGGTASWRDSSAQILAGADAGRYLHVNVNDGQTFGWELWFQPESGPPRLLAARPSTDNAVEWLAKAGVDAEVPVAALAVSVPTPPAIASASQDASFPLATDMPKLRGMKWGVKRSGR